MMKKKKVSLSTIIRATRALERARVKKSESKIRARLVIYGHADMSDEEFSFFQKWLTMVLPQTAKNKRGELSKVFKQTLYK